MVSNPDGYDGPRSQDGPFLKKVLGEFCLVSDNYPEKRKMIWLTIPVATLVGFVQSHDVPLKIKHAVLTSMIWMLWDLRDGKPLYNVFLFCWNQLHRARHP